jgi:heat shock protein HtpX
MGNTVKTTVLLASLSGLLLVMGDLLGGRSGLIVALGFAVVMNIGSYWFSDKLVLAMYKAQPVGPEHPLHQIVQRLSQRAGLPMPKVYIIPDASPNAFATGRNPEHAKVAVTQGILQILDERELRAVLAHELSHVANHDILISSIAAGIGTSISYLAQFALFFGGGDEEGGNPLFLLLAWLVAPIAAAIIQMAVSRSREFQADESGAYLSHDPMALARALTKLEQTAKQVPPPRSVSPAEAHMFIVNPLAGVRGSGVSRLFSTHPATEERIQRLTAIARDLGQGSAVG